MFGSGADADPDARGFEGRSEGGDQTPKAVEGFRKKGDCLMMGAGGTRGGVGRFVIGFVMLVAGGYLFLNNIHVSTNFRFGGLGMSSFRSFGGFSTSGYVFIPFIFGIGLIFYNYKNIAGWLLFIAAMIMLTFGVITSINLRLVSMSAFQLISIIVLMIGGLGLFLSSLRSL